MNNDLHFYFTDSLVKIFPETKRVRKLHYATALLNETLHLQLFIRANELKKELSLVCPMQGITLKSVEYIPALVCNLQGADEYTVGKTGVFPDLLLDLSKTFFSARAKIASAVFVCVDCKKLGVGKHVIPVFLKQGTDVLARTEITVEVIGESLKDNDLIVTEWMHFDCLADYYQIKPWTDKFFTYVKNLLKTAVFHGINTVLVPCFTPPLDTAPNRKRTNVQLVKIVYDGERYVFDFSLLEKFVAIAKDCGIKYFEINHLFSQWGAEFCPNVYVRENGKNILKFGWNVSSESEGYRAFLREYLPALYACLQRLGVEKNTLWHISDEPAAEHLERYKRHLALLKGILPDCKVMDALSEYAFKGTGMDIPVVALDAVTPFIENQDKIMVYYCTAQDKRYVPNHFFSTPSERNRVLGVLMYKTSALGVLHWGFNFYNSFLSKKKIDPYWQTDSGGVYQAGDAFVVYPGRNGETESSLRLEVFYEGIQDYCALKRLEEIVGRDFVVGLLNKRGYVDYFEYPHSGKALLDLRKEINYLLKKKTKRI